MNTPFNILIVDDHTDFLDLVDLTLISAGYHTLIAHDGFEALNILQTEGVDLILADIGMPGLNGYQLLHEVQQNPLWAAIPFIFLTARSLNSDISYGKQMGVSHYLTKPVRAGDLLFVVEHHTGMVYA